MIRVLCIGFIILTNFHYDMKLNFVYGDVNHSIEIKLNRVMKTIKDYIGGIKNYIGTKTLFSDHDQSVRNEFIKNIELALKDIGPPGRAGGKLGKKSTNYPVKVMDIKNKTHNQLKYKMNAAQMIKSYGLKVETHKIQTYDGYILTTQRILTYVHKEMHKEIIIMHHGLLGSSEDWLLLGIDLCLPCLLVEHGFEVWLLNARGNKYSRTHESLDPKSFEFWDFTWHEMGVFDLPAAITYIRESAVGAHLHYIGHSMGGTALLVLLSSIPEYNNHLKSAILLAPLAYMYHAKGPLKHFGNFHHHRSVISQIAEEPREFMADAEYHTALLKKYCLGSRKTCSNSLLLLADGGKEIADLDIRTNVLNHVPGGGSTKTMMHYMQLIKSGTFRRFDFGMLNNLKSYRQKYPPKYNLSAIHLPMLLFSSASDWLASTSDVTTLVTQIDSVKSHHVVREENFGHLDFLWSQKAPSLVYFPIIDAIESMQPRKKGNSLVPRMI